MSTKYRINPLTMNLDMVSDGESGAVKQRLNPLTGNFDMVGEGDVKMKYNPFTSNFDMVSEGGGGGGGRLPAAYQEVEYIESNADGQVIDTGIYSNMNTISTEIRLQYNMDYNNDDRGIWGTYWSANALLLTNFMGYFRWHNYGNRLDTNEVVDAPFIIKTTPTDITLNGSNVNIVSGGVSDEEADHTICLFTTHNRDYAGGGYFTQQSGVYKLYYFKIWDNGVLVRDLVPCYRKSDNAIGLYDLVENQFYTNLGNGNFTKGDNVTQVYSIDFTNCTEQNIIEDGWLAYDTDFGLALHDDNTGLGPTTEYTDTPASLEMKIDSLTGKKVTIDMDVYVEHAYMRGGIQPFILDTDSYDPTQQSKLETRRRFDCGTIPLYQTFPYDGISGVYTYLDVNDSRVEEFGNPNEYCYLGNQGNYNLGLTEGTSETYWHITCIVNFVNNTSTISITNSTYGGTGTFTRDLSGVQGMSDLAASENLYLSINCGRGFGNESVDNRIRNFSMTISEPEPIPPTETVNITIRTSDYSKGLIENDGSQTAVEYYAEVPVGSQINYNDPVLYLSSGYYTAVWNRGYYFSNRYPAPSIATEDVTIDAYWQNTVEVNSNIFTESACPFTFQGGGSITVHGNFEYVQIVSPNGSGDPNTPDSCLIVSVNGTTRPQQYDSDANAFVCWIYNTVMDTDIEISLNGHGDTTFDIAYKWTGSNEINDQWTLREALSTVQIDLISTDSSLGTIVDGDGNTSDHWEIAVDGGSEIAYGGDDIYLYENGVQKRYYGEPLDVGYTASMTPQPSVASEDTQIFFQWINAYWLYGLDSGGNTWSLNPTVQQWQLGVGSWDHIKIQDGFAENWQFRVSGASTDPIPIEVTVEIGGVSQTINPTYDPDRGAFVFDTGQISGSDSVTISILPGYSDVEFVALLETPNHDIYDNDTWTIHALT